MLFVHCQIFAIICAIAFVLWFPEGNRVYGLFIVLLPFSSLFAYLHFEAIFVSFLEYHINLL